MEANEGCEIYLAELGIVTVRHVYPSGSARVEDCNGRYWLVPADVMASNEVSLFSFGENQ